MFFASPVKLLKSRLRPVSTKQSIFRPRVTGLFGRCDCTPQAKSDIYECLVSNVSIDLTNDIILTRTKQRRLLV